MTIDCIAPRRSHKLFLSLILITITFLLSPISSIDTHNTNTVSHLSWIQSQHCPPLTNQCKEKIDRDRLLRDRPRLHRACPKINRNCTGSKASGEVKDETCTKTNNNPNESTKVNVVARVNNKVNKEIWRADDLGEHRHRRNVTPKPGFGTKLKRIREADDLGEQDRHRRSDGSKPGFGTELKTIEVSGSGETGRSARHQTCATPKPRLGIKQDCGRRCIEKTKHKDKARTKKIRT